MAETIDSRTSAHDSRLGDKRELALLSLIKEGDFDARQKMIAHNLRLALNSTRRYANIRLFDLLKAGNLGLAYALENFEREGHGRFSAYADQCIRQSIEYAIQNWDGCGPAWLEKPDHDRYRIVANDDTNPSSVHLIRDPGLPAHDQIN
ncbi:hypothetical protein [Candidatus Ferrigenium straubiae]|jgi:DNA-directed RNA polymerase specialized sigma subunit|uniref:hypothetical protein n=1 Tax=Candidatus Ferrigenium straubiae TaxID=2919506 RepID=UPI003F4AA48B